MKAIFILTITCYLFPFSNILAQDREVLIQNELSDALNGDSLFQHVTQWSQFDNHLTGSQSDRSTGDWLAERLRQAGYKVTFQEMTIPLFSFEEAEMIVDGKQVECFPIWTPANTGDLPVSASLIEYDSSRALPYYSEKLVFFPLKQLRMKEFQQGLEVIKAGASGLVLSYPHPAGVLGAVNSPQPEKPLPVPIVLVGGKSLEFLQQKAVNQSPASIKIKGNFNPEGHTRNIIGSLDRSKDQWVVISTPASGWFQCVGERGTGVAVLLGLAEWAAQQDADVNWLVCITTGHELRHAGIEHLMKSNVLPDPSSTVTFVSLGASVAARDWEQKGDTWKPMPRLTQGLRLVSSTELADHVKSSFNSLLEVKATDQPEGGELSHIMNVGYPVIGLYGGHFWFHTIEDKLNTTDPILLQSVAEALASSLELILEN